MLELEKALQRLTRWQLLFGWLTVIDISTKTTRYMIEVFQPFEVEADDNFTIYQRVESNKNAFADEYLLISFG